MNYPKIVYCPECGIELSATVVGLTEDGQVMSTYEDVPITLAPSKQFPTYTNKDNMEVLPEPHISEAYCPQHRTMFKV